MYRNKTVSQNALAGLPSHIKVIGVLIVLFVWAWCIFSLDVPSDTDAPIDGYSVSSNVSQNALPAVPSAEVHLAHSSVQN
ncbi:MAG TPA: hypothetical protein VHD56_00700 [Tepidisphaeraceae bacterium]|nr:hypothetical protein [Tepidisphaeraceae bacterium]